LGDVSAEGLAPTIGTGGQRNVLKVLYHRTTKKAARAIIVRGFRDTTNYYIIERPTTGVWLSDQPLGLDEGAGGDTLLRVVLRISNRDLDFYEWREMGRSYRGWQFPADFINARSSRIVLVPPRFEAQQRSQRFPSMAAVPGTPPHQ
jgi:hypothetical protein